MPTDAAKFINDVAAKCTTGTAFILIIDAFDAAVKFNTDATANFATGHYASAQMILLLVSL